MRIKRHGSHDPGETNSLPLAFMDQKKPGREERD